MEGGGSILAEEKPRVGMAIKPWRFFWRFRRFPKWGYPMLSSVIERIHGPEFSGKPSSGGPRLQGLELECTMDDQDGQSKSKELHVGQKKNGLNLQQIMFCIVPRPKILYL